MTPPLEQSIGSLLRISRKDETALMLPLEDVHFGYCAQQAMEKLLKALIGGHERRYAFTHDLGELMRAAEGLGEVLPVRAEELEELTGYAGKLRYTDSEELGEMRREEIRSQVAALRQYVIGRLEVLGEGIDWQKKLDR